MTLCICIRNQDEFIKMKKSVILSIMLQIMKHEKTMFRQMKVKSTNILLFILYHKVVFGIFILIAMIKVILEYQK